MSLPPCPGAGPLGVAWPTAGHRPGAERPGRPWRAARAGSFPAPESGGSKDKERGLGQCHRCDRPRRVSEERTGSGSRGTKTSCLPFSLPAPLPLLHCTKSPKLETCPPLGALSQPVGSLPLTPLVARQTSISLSKEQASSTVAQDRGMPHIPEFQRLNKGRRGLV